MDVKHCQGCRDDYYNGQGAKQCRLLPKAELVTRWSIGTWTLPTRPGGFVKCRVPDCYHQDGWHCYGEWQQCVVKAVKGSQ